MQKKALSSLELTAIVNELQFLVKGRINQIYNQEKKELLFQLHASGKGKHLLKIVPGRYLCLTENKDPPLRPSGFCMQLRKYLNNAFIKAIQQKDSERIVVFEIQKKKKYYLIMELFSKGNMVLTDEKYMIIGLLETQEWKDRTVKAREKYIFPKPGFNWKEISEEKLKKILKKSDKKNLATSLATEIGLGGLYAEEICKINSLASQKLPKDTDGEEIKLIVKTLKDFLKKTEKPKGYLYDEQITPFPLTEEKTKSETKTYSKVIDKLNPLQIISPYENKIKTVEIMISGQEKAIKNLETKIELNKKKGELVYEKYPKLQKLLEIVKELRKTKGWADITKELKKEKKIKKVDLKEKKVAIDL